MAVGFWLLAFGRWPLNLKIIRADSCLSVDRKYYGVPAIAVGLSAVSFSASLQKDAAPIPNARGAAETAGRSLH